MKQKSIISKLEKEVIPTTKKADERRKESDTAFDDNCYYLSGGNPSELEAILRMDADTYNVFLKRRIDENHKQDGSN